MEFGDGVIKYTKDGASYIDSRGKAIWIQSYEMKSPFVTVNGDFAAIGDKQGNSIYICDRSGLPGTGYYYYCRSFHCPYLQKEW